MSDLAGHAHGRAAALDTRGQQPQRPAGSLAGCAHQPRAAKMRAMEPHGPRSSPVGRTHPPKNRPEAVLTRSGGVCSRGGGVRIGSQRVGPGPEGDGLVICSMY